MIGFFGLVNVVYERTIRSEDSCSSNDYEDDGYSNNDTIIHGYPRISLLFELLKFSLKKIFFPMAHSCNQNTLIWSFCSQAIREHGIFHIQKASVEALKTVKIC